MKAESIYFKMNCPACLELKQTEPFEVAIECKTTKHHKEYIDGFILRRNIKIIQIELIKLLKIREIVNFLAKVLNKGRL